MNRSFNAFGGIIQWKDASEMQPPGTITRLQLLEASALYWDAVSKLPAVLQEACPEFKDFLVPDRYPYLHQTDWVTLSTKGAGRYEMLHSPHIITLLTIYAIQSMEAV